MYVLTAMVTNQSEMLSYQLRVEGASIDEVERLLDEELAHEGLDLVQIIDVTGPEERK